MYEEDKDLKPELECVEIEVKNAYSYKGPRITETFYDVQDGQTLTINMKDYT